MLCNMDPNAAKTLMSCLKQLAGNLMMKRLSEDQVEGIADEYQMATLAAVKKEKEALEEKRRYMYMYFFGFWVAFESLFWCAKPSYGALTYLL